MIAIPIDLLVDHLTLFVSRSTRSLEISSDNWVHSGFWIHYNKQDNNRVRPSPTFSHRTAGTVGAVVTCPLEVVKTRLQSSSAFIPSQPSNGTKGRFQVSANSSFAAGSGAAGAVGTNNNVTTNDALLKPEQRRRLCTTILRKRHPQVSIELTNSRASLFYIRINLSCRFWLYPPVAYPPRPSRWVLCSASSEWMNELQGCVASGQSAIVGQRMIFATTENWSDSVRGWAIDRAAIDLQSISSVTQIERSERERWLWKYAILLGFMIQQGNLNPITKRD